MSGEILALDLMKLVPRAELLSLVSPHITLLIAHRAGLPLAPIYPTFYLCVCKVIVFC